ncbi:MAG: restriction endonuclease subunit S [Alphaproteobacteria bacterium]|nr:restriction endonuclease subunit S [Alphaproteobacteria bacterium]
MQNNQKIPEGWSVKKISDLGNVVSGGTPDTNNSEYWDGDILWVTPSEVSSLSNRFISNTERKITEKGLKESSAKLLPINSLIICTRATIGDCCINNVPMCTNQGFKNVIVKNNNVDFLYYLITKNKNELIRKACGSTFLEISKKDIDNLKFAIPPLLEQEKIAGILGTWDEAIEKLSSLIEQKKLLKKGLMQRLIYNRNDIKLYRVADLFELGRGRVISKEEIEKNRGEYPVYSSQTSNNGVLGCINTYDFQGEYITWTTDGANAGEVFYRNGKFNCTNVCGTAKLKKDSKVNLYYAMSFLNHVSKKYVSYVGNPKLMNGVFATIPLELPTLEIQNKIANILSTADEEIDLLNKKLEALKEQKKGLMQQLLTGQTRVKVN